MTNEILLYIAIGLLIILVAFRHLMGVLLVLVMVCLGAVLFCLKAFQWLYKGAFQWWYRRTR